MRKNQLGNYNNTKILLVDDEIGIIESLSVVLKREGYYTEGITSPLQAIAKLQNEHFDILILDFLMSPIHGDKVVEKVREFNKDIYIILLTGHKDMAPPLETIKSLQIQAYCEKSDNFDQLLLLVEAGRKASNQISEISLYQQGLNKIIDFIPKMYQTQTIDKITEEIIDNLNGFASVQNAFISINDPFSNKNVVRGIGKFSNGIKSLDTDMLNSLIKITNDGQTYSTETGTWFPLTNSADASGVIYIEFENDGTNAKLIDIFVKQISSYINFTLLQSLVKIRSSQLANNYQANENDYKHIINIIKLLLYKTDDNIGGHCERVSYYALKIGEAFNLNEQEMETLRVSGLLHDIFNNGNLDDIHLDCNNLNYDDITKHILRTNTTLEKMSMFNEIGHVIANHHERLDGSGYPNGLKAAHIPFLSKIIAVADTFDVLMNCSYKGARLGMDEIKDILYNGKDTLFDSNIVDNFISLLDDYYLMEKELKDTYL